MTKNPTKNEAALNLIAEAKDRLIRLLQERRNWVTCVSSHPCIITACDSYLGDNPAKKRSWKLRDRQNAIGFSPRDAETVLADAREVWPDAKIVTRWAALMQDIENTIKEIDIIGKLLND